MVLMFGANKLRFIWTEYRWRLKLIYLKQHEHPKQESGESLAKVYRLEAQQKGGKKELAVNL